MNQVAENWKDYECMDTGNGEKLERWKDIILRRPDPQVIWPIAEEDALWKQPHATIIAVNPAVAVGNIKRSLKTAGPSNIKIFVLKFHQPDSSIPDCFLNRQPIGIS